MERREPSTLPVYSKANLKPTFTSMQRSQKNYFSSSQEKVLEDSSFENIK